jgi:hypothetical protein
MRTDRRDCVRGYQPGFAWLAAPVTAQHRRPDLYL